MVLCWLMWVREVGDDGNVGKLGFVVMLESLGRILLECYKG